MIRSIMSMAVLVPLLLLAGCTQSNEAAQPASNATVKQESGIEPSPAEQAAGYDFSRPLTKTEIDQCKKHPSAGCTLLAARQIHHDIQTLCFETLREALLVNALRRLPEELPTPTTKEQIDHYSDYYGHDFSPLIYLAACNAPDPEEVKVLAPKPEELTTIRDNTGQEFMLPRPTKERIKEEKEKLRKHIAEIRDNDKRYLNKVVGQYIEQLVRIVETTSWNEGLPLTDIQRAVRNISRRNLYRLKVEPSIFSIEVTDPSNVLVGDPGNREYAQKIWKTHAFYCGSFLQNKSTPQEESTLSHDDRRRRVAEIIEVKRLNDKLEQALSVASAKYSLQLIAEWKNESHRIVERCPDFFKKVWLSLIVSEFVFRVNEFSPPHLKSREKCCKLALDLSHQAMYLNSHIPWGERFSGESGASVELERACKFILVNATAFSDTGLWAYLDQACNDVAYVSALHAEVVFTGQKIPELRQWIASIPPGERYLRTGKTTRDIRQTSERLEYVDRQGMRQAARVPTDPITIERPELTTVEDAKADVENQIKFLSKCQTEAMLAIKNELSNNQK